MTIKTGRRVMVRSMLMASAAGMGIASATGCSQITSPVWTGQMGKPVNLRCEYRVDPLGIDVTTPRLSWEVNDPRRAGGRGEVREVRRYPRGGAAGEGDKGDSA